MTLNDLLDPFYDPALTETLTHAGGTFEVFFYEDDAVESLGIEGYRAAARCRQSDAALVADEANVTIAGVTYKVKAHRRTNKHERLLVLEEQ